MSFLLGCPLCLVLEADGQGEFFCLLHGNLYTALDYRPFFERTPPVMRTVS